ncbi:MAG TPA: PH domain-containing protein [Candidatus Nanopelagicales bacterium]|jgi:membrane protein YdbS with pleckstrin-like domain|nr:PH domain-containing protein [Candidatus Nanopelagicales bacterium]
MDAFAPPGGGWVRVSPALVTARRISLGLGYLLVVAALVVLWLLPAVPRLLTVLLTVGAAAVFCWAWWLIGRRVRSWGYSVRSDDLLVGSGILFRRLVIVPYGRMQLVDVVAGPIDRWLGVATVQLHTAAATTDAAIPGLVPDVAAELRDTLARLGEARTAGL